MDFATDDNSYRSAQVAAPRKPPEQQWQITLHLWDGASPPTVTKTAFWYSANLLRGTTLAKPSLSRSSGAS
jgi:hypothetical protein